MMKEMLFLSGITYHLLVLILLFTLTLNDIQFPFYAAYSLDIHKLFFFFCILNLYTWKVGIFLWFSLTFSSHCYARKAGISTGQTLCKEGTQVCIVSLESRSRRRFSQLSWSEGKP